MPNEPEVISLDPQYVSDVLEDIKRIGRATNSEDAAKLITDQMQARIDNVVNRLATVVNKPKVLHLEWVDPLMCGGHWVPEMVELAGGINCFGDKETGSFPLEWESIIDSQPEVIVLMPCGFDVKRGLQDLPLLSNKDGWANLPAVKNNRVYVIDAGAYTSRSGPRLVDGLEILAEMTHPGLFSGMVPESGALRIYGDLINAT